MYNIFFYKDKKGDKKLINLWRIIYKEVMKMSKSKINPKGSSWDELEKQLFTSEEIAESEVRVAIINEMIKAREENGITQKQLEAMSGIKQPVISRMENGTSDPQLSTVLKILNSLGKTLQIVPMK